MNSSTKMTEVFCLFGNQGSVRWT